MLLTSSIYKHMKRAATQFVLSSKLSNFHFGLRHPGQTPRQDRGAKTRPLGQLECANPQGSPGGLVRLGIVFLRVTKDQALHRTLFATNYQHIH